MKKILILLISLALWADSYKDIKLLDFTQIVSSYNNVNFYIDEDINTSISLFIPDKTDKKDLLKLLEKSLYKKDYLLKKLNNNYYIKKKELPFYKNHNYSYTLKYNTFEDCKKILDFYKVTYNYLNDTSTFLISAKKSLYDEILPLLQKADTKKKQVTLKITIFEYSEGEIYERGLSSLSMQDGYNNPRLFNTTSQTTTNTVQPQEGETLTDLATQMLSSIISPTHNSNLIFRSKDFNLALSLLDSNKLADIKQSPFILARNNDRFKFYAVDNIPFKTSTTTTQSANLSTNESIDYKDVGLKIEGKAHIYDDYVSLDLSLIVEDIVSQSNDNVPQTYKRELNSLSNVNYGDVLLLSGLKRTKKQTSDYSIPYLSNVPYLGELFKHKSQSEQVLNITIAIEVIEAQGARDPLVPTELAKSHERE